MNETTRAERVLRALNGFFSAFLPAYGEGCAPEGAALPYITYQLTVPEPLGEAALYAWVWARGRGYEDIAAAADALGEAIGAGCCLPVEGGTVWLYRAERFIQFLPVASDGDVKRACLSMKIAVNA